jgi:hypothetical protein
MINKGIPTTEIWLYFKTIAGIIDSDFPQYQQRAGRIRDRDYL